MAELLLDNAQIEALVITHAHFFEKEVGPELKAELRERLDTFIGNCGHVYADEPHRCSVLPTVEGAQSVLGEVHVVLPGGPIKTKLGAIMKSLDAPELPPDIPLTVPYRQ